MNNKTNAKKYRKVISTISIILTIALVISFIGGAAVYRYDTWELVPFLTAAFAANFDSYSNDEVKVFKEKTGGIVKGVCHAYNNLDLMADANIGWVRFDFDLRMAIYDNSEDNILNYGYFKNIVKMYESYGVKVMCVFCANIREFEAYSGLSPLSPEGKALLTQISQDFIREIDGLVPIVQVCNEITMERFREPYTLDEAVEIAGTIMKAMREVDSDVLVGYNSTMHEAYMLSNKLMPYMDYVDYIGLDGYIGSFDPYTKTVALADSVCKGVWNLTHKPQIICEFGYKGAGESKTDQEKQEILESYGFSSEEEAKANIMEFVSKLPEQFQYMIETGIEYDSEEELAEKLFSGDNAEHIYKELPEEYYVFGCEHNEEGQAKFITESIDRYKKYDFVCGAFVYCYMDADSCYYCGQTDCPIETSWGLLDRDGNPKPSYYATAEAFANWN